MPCLRICAGMAAFSENTIAVIEFLKAACGDMEEGFAYFCIAMNGLNHFG